MAPTDGEDEKYYFKELMLLWKSKRKRKRALSFYGNGLDCEREKDL